MSTIVWLPLTTIFSNFCCRTNHVFECFFTNHSPTVSGHVFFSCTLKRELQFLMWLPTTNQGKSGVFKKVRPEIWNQIVLPPLSVVCVFLYLSFQSWRRQVLLCFVRLDVSLCDHFHSNGIAQNLSSRALLLLYHRSAIIIANTDGNLPPCAEGSHEECFLAHLQMQISHHPKILYLILNLFAFYWCVTNVPRCGQKMFRHTPNVDAFQEPSVARASSQF